MFIAPQLRAQSLEKTILLGPPGACVEELWLSVYDSSSNSVYAVGEVCSGLVAVNASTRTRTAYIALDDDNSSSCALLSVPGHNRVFCVTDRRVYAVDTRSSAVIARCELRAPEEHGFNGAGCNPLTGKVYCTYYPDSVLVLEGETGEVVKRLRIGHTEDFEDFMPFAVNARDNKVYFSAYDSNRAGLVALDGAADSVVARITPSPDPYWRVLAICYDDVNNLVWCGVSDTTPYLLAFDGTTDSVVASIRIAGGYEIAAVCFAGADNRVYCLTEGGMITSVDAGTRRVLGSMYAGDMSRPLMCVNGREHKLYCTGEECARVTVFDTRDDSWLGEVGGFEWPTSLVYSPLTNEVGCTDYDLATITFIDCSADSVTAVVRTWAFPREACLDAEGGRLFVSGPDPGIVSIVDCASDSTVHRVAVGFVPEDAYEGTLCWNQHEQTLFYGAPQTDSVAVIDVPSRRVVARLPVPLPNVMLLNPLDNEVYCCGQGLIVLLAGDGRSILDTIRPGLDPQCAALDTSSGWLYVAGYGGLVAIDCALRAVVDTLSSRGVHRGNMLVVPQERKLYCTESNSVAIFDLDSNRFIGAVPVNDYISGLCYDPLTRRVFCAIGGSGIAVLDAQGDTTIARVTTPDAPSWVGLNRTSGSVCWVGDSLLGFIDEGSFECRTTLRIPHLRPMALCDEADNQVFFFDLSSVHVVHDKNLGRLVRGRTGPSHVGRDVVLYGTVNADLLDVSGRKVMTLRPGPNRLADISPGTYFVTRRGQSETQKVILLW